MLLVMSQLNYITHNVGVKEYCFVSNGLCCVPPSEDFPPTPVEAYTLKLSDQFSTSVEFYSAGGAKGNLHAIYLLHMKLEIIPQCMHAFCGFFLLRSVL